MDEFQPRRSPVHARHGMAASSSPLITQTGLDVLRDGGNAVDAAIAMVAMGNVVEPMMTGLGGDAFMLVHWKGKLHGLNASGRCPKAMTRRSFTEAGWRQMPQAGWGSVTVPGALDGYFTLHEKFGSRKFADLVEPAAACAEDGFAVGQKIAAMWNWGASKLRLCPDAPSQYLIDGIPPVPGQIFRQPLLATTWRKIARRGRDYFYEGKLAEKIVAASEAGGGYLTLKDLAAQHSEWAEPISSTYRGRTIYEMPPNGQGIIALLALRILEGYDLGALFHADLAEATHVVLEAIKLSFADGMRYVGDPVEKRIPVEELLSDTFVASRRKLISKHHAIPTPTAGRIPGDTTYLTVVDSKRNAVSVITSLSDAFGSGMVAGDTGIILHNRGAEFSLEAGHPNEVRPGYRPRHSLLPAMVFEEDRLRMTFGCMGGNMQPQGQAQILINLFDRGMDLQEALDAPRARSLGGNRISLESSYPSDLAPRLAALGHEIVTGEEAPHDWLRPHDFAHSFHGSAQAIAIDPVFGTLAGASDPRLDGVALGY